MVTAWLPHRLLGGAFDCGLPLGASTALPDPFAAPGDFEEPTWFGALAALALCHGETQRRRGQTKAFHRREAYLESLACA